LKARSLQGIEANLQATLYTRTGCHLCEEAKEVIFRVSAGFDFHFAEVDVDESPELVARYGEKVPVLVIDGGPTIESQIDERSIRLALRGLQRLRPSQ
jgi:glutaredoxin